MKPMDLPKKIPRNKYLYPTGKPYSPEWLTDQINSIKERIMERDLPGGILIVAPPGKGKTTMICHIAKEFQGKTIDMDSQLGNGFEDFQKKLQISRLKNLSVTAYDEGGDIDKRRFMSDTNYKIRRIFQLARGFKKLIIMAIHDFSILDDAILNLEVIRWMIYIPWRGKNDATFKLYSLRQMFMVLSTMQYLKKTKQHPSKAYSIIYPLFHGRFKNLPPDEALALRKFSLAAKEKMLDDFAGNNEGLYTFKDMAAQLGKSVQWCKNKVTDLGIAKVKEKNGKNMYTEETLNLLAGEGRGG